MYHYRLKDFSFFFFGRNSQSFAPLLLLKLVRKAQLMVGVCFTSTETISLLGMGAQDIHLDFH